MDTVIMAKARKTPGKRAPKAPASAPAPAPKPDLAGRKPMVVQLRGSEEWKRWAEGLADQEGYTLALLVERALRKWAKEVNYPDPPRR